MKNTIFWENILKQIQDIGVTQFARQSGIGLANLEMWSYTNRTPRLSGALKVYKALGIEIGVNSLEEFIGLSNPRLETELIIRKLESGLVTRQMAIEDANPQLSKRECERVAQVANEEMTAQQAQPFDGLDALSR